MRNHLHRGILGLKITKSFYKNLGYNDGYSPDKELLLLLRWLLIFLLKFKSFKGNFKFESLDFSVQLNNYLEMLYIQ